MSKFLLIYLQEVSTMDRSEIIGRKQEIDRLDRCMDSSEPQLIALYGRRRVGKTFLVNHYFNGRFDFKLTGIYDQPVDIQLKNFAIELSGQTGDDMVIPSDWMEAFSMLKSYIESRPDDSKVVVFFDEMPWMDTVKSGFVAAFEWFWNSYGNARTNLVFVICGSATSWMRANLDANKGGLYNRLTCRLYLRPFTLAETEQYLQSRGISWSRYDIVECYMIIGGIPYYQSLLLPDMSLAQNVDNIFFRKRAELWDEFRFLYQTLFKNSAAYISIAEALSRKRNGMMRDEIVRESGLPNNGRITQMLNDMEYSGFVRINDQYGIKGKRYQLSDNYTFFYFLFIKDNYGRDEHFWSHMLDNPARRAWAGLTFEQVCMDHIPQIKKGLGISGVLSENSVWASRGDDGHDGAQIDLLIKRRDRVTNICEIKFSTGEFAIDKKYDLALRNKITAFQSETGTKDTLQLTFITTYGVKKNKYSGIVQNEVTMDDLFA